MPAGAKGARPSGAYGAGCCRHRQGRPGAGAKLEQHRSRSERAFAELKAFSAAVERRFGEEGVRALLRSSEPGPKPFDGGAAAAAAEQARLPEVARAAAIIKSGERPSWSGSG